MYRSGSAFARSLALLVAEGSLLALPAAGNAQAAEETDIISTREDAHDRLTVPVWIGKQGPYRFLIDTGAQNTVVSSILASELSLRPGGKATIVTVAGGHAVNTAEVDGILLGRRRSGGLRAPILERTHIGADGILGIDSLQGQRVLFDFSRNLVAIDRAKELGGDTGFEIVVHASRRDKQLIMTHAAVDGVRTEVVVDTGSDATIGNRALRQALSRKMRSLPATLYSVTGHAIAADIAAACAHLDG